MTLVNVQITYKSYETLYNEKNNNAEDIEVYSILMRTKTHYSNAETFENLERTK
ncbi:hypothetical protein [Ursidibacter sp. B-7004-1]|nr:hypothetical protein [Ursidibacter maritimus]